MLGRRLQPDKPLGKRNPYSPNPRYTSPHVAGMAILADRDQYVMMFGSRSASSSSSTHINNSVYENIRDMLELHNAGERAQWPDGTDADTARNVLAEYDLMKTMESDEAPVDDSHTLQARGDPSLPEIGGRPVTYVAAKTAPKRHSFKRRCVTSMAEYKKHIATRPDIHQPTAGPELQVLRSSHHLTIQTVVVELNPM